MYPPLCHLHWPLLLLGLGGGSVWALLPPISLDTSPHAVPHEPRPGRLSVLLAPGFPHLGPSFHLHLHLELSSPHLLLLSFTHDNKSCHRSSENLPRNCWELSLSLHIGCSWKNFPFHLCPSLCLLSLFRQESQTSLCHRKTHDKQPLTLLVKGFSSPS